MLNYKNIIFDFGNVIAEYNEDYIFRQFCADAKDLPTMAQAILPTWPQLDYGSLDYQEVKEQAMQSVPSHLTEAVENFYDNWYRCLLPIKEIWSLIEELHNLRIPLYILSNAPTLFAAKADYYEITKKFTGILFSAPLKMGKPNPDFYRYLFDTYSLIPEECFFIDDRSDNIMAGRSLGMDGIVFTGDVQAVRKAIGLP